MQPFSGGSPQSEETDPGWEDDSPQSSPQFAPDSPQFDGSSPQSSRLARLAPDVAALLPLADPARRNKNLPADRLRAIIQQLCAGRWLAASEIAALVEIGRITLTAPSRPECRRPDAPRIAISKT